jgi:polysaccharide pyruvyl transferase WcaK-like protein
MFRYYFNYYKRFTKALLVEKTKKDGESRYPSIGLVNTSIGTTNLGDLIIYDSVYRHLRSIYPEAFMTNYPSHLQGNYATKLLMADEDVIFVGGTNLLSSYMDSYNQWKITPLDSLFLKKKYVLMGVGWWQYQEKPNLYTRKLLTSILSDKYVHSVRDEYTKNMLNSIGISNVVNTSCPTLWGVTDASCREIPTIKAKDVITTLTFYKMDSVADSKLLNILLANYSTVYLWIQGIDDLSYLRDLLPDYDRIVLIPPTMEAYDAVLNKGDVEYLGTRLHAGIRAIQMGLRSLIVAVDNRALEIGKDTGLNVISRDNLELCYDYINNSFTTEINLPKDKISSWKNQFSHKKEDAGQIVNY